MANAVGKRHWNLDTEGSVSTAPLYIRSISWYGVSGDEIADNDICEILDAAGGTRIFYRMATAAVPDITVSFGGPGLKVDGLYLNDLDAGNVLVTIA